MADFDPRGAKTPEPNMMKLGMVDYVRDPISQHNVGGLAKYVTCHISEFLFFFLFLACFRAHPGLIN